MASAEQGVSPYPPQESGVLRRPRGLMRSPDRSAAAKRPMRYDPRFLRGIGGNPLLRQRHRLKKDDYLTSVDI